MQVGSEPYSVVPPGWEPWSHLNRVLRRSALPDETGIVEATLDCTITGGTGRFAGATGSYDFSFVASPRTDGGPGYATEV